MSITKKQVEFIDKIFEEGLTESEALEKLNIKDFSYRKWLKDDGFQAEMDYRMESAKRQGEILIARHSGYAAAKLIQLANSEKEETARKACLDILEHGKMLSGNPQSRSDNNDCQDAESTIELSPEASRKMLEILANPNLN